ncbi:MAG: rRNA pseudouridine synthase [Candidatus Pacebacteria bacterium]|jgi:23S rRNA pseudouridine2604 synthase|nr:rRNA pseudouridine synthase [Candidatus Paceibacterota bacterium]MBP9780573.1 rRNA pseudouridine synthase [Candidatus Paceibacterota bacterium]MDQ5961666.1 rRNA pseudouridine2604 synthase [Patescibacteria group bacterium]
MKSKTQNNNDDEAIRLNLHMAQIGLTTRRGADELIKKGEVFVNGKMAVLGQKVSPSDNIEILAHAAKVPHVYYAYNKPVGIVTVNPGSGEKDILSTTTFPTKVFPVGRLDKDSHGLIIMTNDGRVTSHLLSPEKDHEKEYVVQTDTDFNEFFLDKLSRGVKFDTYTTKPCKTKQLDSDTFSIILTEGKNRQIRRMVSIFRHFVKDLKRVRIENIKLGPLKEGKFRAIEGKELDTFLKKIGIKK